MCISVKQHVTSHPDVSMKALELKNWLGHKKTADLSADASLEIKFKLEFIMRIYVIIVIKDY